MSAKATGGKGKDCINRAVAAGLLDPQLSAKLIGEIDRIEAENFDALGPIGAKRMANADALAQATYEAAIRRRAAAMQLLEQDRVARALDDAEARLGKKDQTALARGIVDSTGLDELHFRGAQQEMRRVRSMAHSIMTDALSRFHTLPGGFARNRAQLVNMVKEIFGEGTGDVMARQMADAWKEAAETLRKMYNAAGGAIPKLKSWNLPQQHNVRKIRNTGFAEWRDFTAPLLDRSAMLDTATGKPLSDAHLDQVLRKVYDSVRTQGWDAVEPSNMVRANPIAARRQESRILHFDGAENWLAYQQQFGEGDPFAAMMSHIDGMAREIGAMRAMGPNPRATIRFLGERMRKQANEHGDNAAINRANRTAQTLNTVYSHYIGDASAPVDGTVARAFSSTRQFLTAAQLGGAVLSAIGDIGFQRITSRFNGIPHWKVMRRHVSLLNPANAGDRKLAVRLGLIAEEWSSVAAGQMRYTGEVISGEVTRRLADGVLRVSGLSAWTQAGRWAFGMEFMGTLADNAGLAKSAMTKPLREALTRYGISDADWDVIRAGPLYEHKGAAFLRPDDLMGRGDLTPDQADALATKLLDMVQSETEFAVPATSIIGKAQLMGEARPGSLAGEFMRSTLMYKNFAITMFHTHLARAAKQNGNWNKVKYFSSLMIHTTLMGALAMQLKDLARGKDPRPMYHEQTGVDPRFLMAAMLQGGGLGIFGDFLSSETSRFGGGLAATTAGPIVGFAGDTISLATAAVTGGNVGREAVQYVGRYTPGASLWYTRLMVERGILDSLQRMADPNAEKSFKAKRQSWGTERGADFWSPPGSGMMPERGPDWANATRTFEEGKAEAKSRRAAAKLKPKADADDSAPQDDSFGFEEIVDFLRNKRMDLSKEVPSDDIIDLRGADQIDGRKATVEEKDKAWQKRRSMVKKPAPGAFAVPAGR